MTTSCTKRIGAYASCMNKLCIAKKRSTNQTAPVNAMVAEPPMKRTLRYVHVRRNTNAPGRKSPTMQSWPISTPMLKPASDNASEPDGNPRSCSAPAKPKPWTRPKPNAAIHLARPTTGNRLLSAASTTDSAIADSIQRDGNDTMLNAASDSVIECATVNAVTILATSTN